MENFITVFRISAQPANSATPTQTRALAEQKPQGFGLHFFFVVWMTILNSQLDVITWTPCSCTELLSSSCRKRFAWLHRRLRENNEVHHFDAVSIEFWFDRSFCFCFLFLVLVLVLVFFFALIYVICVFDVVIVLIGQNQEEKTVQDRPNLELKIPVFTSAVELCKLMDKSLRTCMHLCLVKPLSMLLQVTPILSSCPDILACLLASRFSVLISQ